MTVSRQIQTKDVSGLVGGAFGALQLAAQRRIDVVLVSDSNGQYNGFGWNAAFIAALGNKYGVYATQLYGQEISSTAASTVGNPVSAGIGGAANSTVTPSGTSQTAHSTFSLPTTFAPPLFVSGDLGSNNGMTAGQETDAYGVLFSGFNTGSTLKGYFCYGTYINGNGPSGGNGGSFLPAARQGTSPYGTLATGTSVSAVGATDSYAVATLGPFAGDATHPVELHWRLPGGTATSGNNTLFWTRLEDTLQNAGVSVSSLVYAPGNDLRNFYATLTGYTSTQWTNYFNAITYIQSQAGLEPICVVIINSGDNDVNDATNSIGPLAVAGFPQASNTAAGYLDNLRGVYNKITSSWAAAGLPTSNLNGGGLYFLIMPSQVYGPTSDNATLITMRAAASRFAAGKPNVSFLDIAQLVPIAELLAAGGYNSGVHLNKTTYQYIATKVVNSFLPNYVFTV